MHPLVQALGRLRERDQYVEDFTQNSKHDVKVQSTDQGFIYYGFLQRNNAQSTLDLVFFLHKLFYAGTDGYEEVYLVWYRSSGKCYP